MSKYILLIVAVCLLGSNQIEAGVGSEILKSVGKIVTREVGEEAAEAGGKAAVKSLAKELVEEGSKQAIRRGGTALIRNLGDDLARGVASQGDDVARGLSTLSAKNARRLSMMADELAATGKSSEVVQMIAKGGVGDQVVDFLWRSKGTLVGGAAITTLFMNPDAVLGASSDLGGVIMEVAGQNLMQPLIEHSPVLGSFAVFFPLMLMAIFAFLIIVAFFSKGYFAAWRFAQPVFGYFFRRTNLADATKADAIREEV